MRAVFINHCHPDMPHVCGLRFGKFAEAMAGLGHEIVLLVEAFPDGAAGQDPATLAADLAQHDFRQPFVLSCLPTGHKRAVAARRGDLSGVQRKWQIARSYIAHGGMFADWQAGAEPHLETLVADFKPHVIWSTFGNTDAWTIAQRLASMAGCPWIADFKDNWRAFVPVGLKGLMARRFRDAAHMTVFSEGHCDEADRYFNQTKTVIYSGIDDIGRAQPVDDGFRIVLAGSVYDAARLAHLVAGLESWLSAAPRGSVEFHYAGNDTDMVKAATAGIDARCRRVFHGFIPVEDLARLQVEASVNIHVHNERCIFHHKTIELLAAGRPILSFPDESEETKRLAGEFGTRLFICNNSGHISDALDAIENGPAEEADPSRRAGLTWAARVKVLEAVLGRAVGAIE